MTLAGERVKGATSARPFRGRQGGGAALRPASARSGVKPSGWQRPAGQRKGEQPRGRGAGKRLGLTKPENLRPYHPRLFFSFTANFRTPGAVGCNALHGQVIRCAAIQQGARRAGPLFYIFHDRPSRLGPSRLRRVYGSRRPGERESGRNFCTSRFLFGFRSGRADKWRERQKGKGTVGTVGTLFLTHCHGWSFPRSCLFPLAIFRVGTVGTQGRRAARQENCALVASPARAHRSGGAEL